jgi:hypothetical protein
MGQTHSVSGRATSIRTEDGQTKVRYHNTDVVTWDQKWITLDSGGYSTTTTLRRMNQASNQFGLGYRVYQKDWRWYVAYKGQVIEYRGDILTLAR